eukprot:gb/GEZN01001308.1/.p1 GENE.gb/GEZN01001308.1/~~gb/GEZN01001308.1/.p1  ORF type:complete len:998 (-),score=89.32 gb/GEZN01001308.1/:73-3066(-)
MMDPVVASLLSSPPVWGYFAALFWSIRASFRKSSFFINLLSMCIMGVTWFYIMRFTYVFISTNQPGSFFDEAYVDVISGQNWVISSQLLTWVVVAVVWSHSSSANYLIFGMLGAMSAAFVPYVSLDPPSPRRIPKSYVWTSLGSLLCIAMLPRSTLSRSSFSFWLRALHVLLVLPKFPSVFLLPNLLLSHQSQIVKKSHTNTTTVDSFYLYLFLAPVIALGHNTFLLRADRTAQPIWPSTDCQKSIEFDLLCCSLLTLYAIYKETRSFTRLALAAFLTPLLSPGSVLALHLMTQHFPHSHRELVTSLQQSVAARLCNTKTSPSAPKKSANGTSSGPKMNGHSGGSEEEEKKSFEEPSTPLQWTNLGFWEEHCLSYQEACEELALKLGSSLLEPGDTVLACGCGRGAELAFYKEKFQLDHITGVDASASTAVEFVPTHNVRLVSMPVEDITRNFGPGTFNKILALDNVYHYANKTQFFADCLKMLPPGGAVAVTDIVLTKPGPLPVWLRILLRAANVRGSQGSSLWTLEEYKKKLGEIGFAPSTIKTTSIGHAVLNKWLPEYALKYLDYAIIVAKVPASNKPGRAAKKKVAVIGSGLSGLTVAQLLKHKYAVSIFEARGKPGLSGACTNMYGTMIDVPLRMIGKGYYSRLGGMLDKLDVPTTGIQNSMTFYGDYCRKKEASHYNFVSRSGLLGIITNFFTVIANLPGTLKFHKAITHPENSKVTDSETFGDWLDKRGFNEEALGQNPGMWMLMGQFSWVLSCSYKQVRSYPAKILLEFMEKSQINVTGYVSEFLRGVPVVRADPSIERVGMALAYGCEFKCNVPVQELDERKLIDGVTYDAVVVATEAFAVNKVLKNAPPVFSRFQYQPSSIVLHTDCSLMPKDRSEWQALNICASDKHEMSQLTVWMNRYYPENNFPVDIFQTWNPHHPPKTILKEEFFNRVLHSSETPDLLKGVSEAQGKGGIFYAGSYGVYGMGLLEQALHSGQVAAELIQAYLQ